MSDPAIGSRPRWLRISLRGLLLIVTASCVFLAYCGLRLRAAQQQEAASAAVERAGGGVRFHHLLDNNTLSPRQAAWVPEWLRERAGLHVFERVQTVFLGDPNNPDLRIDDDAMNLLERFPDLRAVCLYSTHITDQGLAPLERCRKLHSLLLWRNKNLTDDGLKSLQRLRQLHSLEIYGRQITDEGLKHLGEVQSLAHLSINGAKVTDAGLAYLENLGRLQELRLEGTDVTPEGARQLQDALPHCRITIP